jgi:hypothetical protein
MTALVLTDRRVLVTHIDGTFHVWESCADEYPVLIEERGEHEIMPGEILAVLRALA